MSLSQQEFTNAGRAMLGRAQNGETLTVSKIVVGSGAASQPSDLWPLTALITHELDVTIGTKIDYGQGTLLVEGAFHSEDAAHAFSLREVGIMAHIGAEADQLYSVANAFTDPPDYVNPASPTIESFKVKLVIDRIPTAQVIVQIGPMEALSGSNIGAQTVGPGVYHDTAGNVMNFKRLVQGANMDIHDAPDGNSIYIGVKTLTVDLDLYVPLTYHGISDPNVLFPTVQAAHDFLLQYVIPPSRTARIHVDAGTFHHGGTNFSHPNSSQIQLLGQPKLSKPITVINYLDAISSPGVRGHKTLQLADTIGLSVGQIVYIKGAVAGWNGGCKITAIAGNIVTCDVPDRSTRAVLTGSSAVAGQTLNWLPTVMFWDDPTPGVRPSLGNLGFPYGINLVQDILAQGGKAGFGLGGSGGIRDCMSYDCLAGVGSTVGLVQLVNDFVGTGGPNWGDWGAVGPGILWFNGTTFLNGCGTGVDPGGAGNGIGSLTTSDPSVVYINHCATGIQALFGASVRGGYLIYTNNNVGVEAGNGSNISLGPNQSLALNNTTDLYAHGLSYIAIVHGGAAPICSPPAGVVGNGNSLIEVS